MVEGTRAGQSYVVKFWSISCWWTAIGNLPARRIVGFRLELLSNREHSLKLCLFFEHSVHELVERDSQVWVYFPAGGLRSGWGVQFPAEFAVQDAAPEESRRDALVRLRSLCSLWCARLRWRNRGDALLSKRILRREKALWRRMRLAPCTALLHVGLQKRICLLYQCTAFFHVGQNMYPGKTSDLIKD